VTFRALGEKGGGGGRLERGAHRGAIDLHYTKITPHAVNLVRRVGIQGISTANVDMNTRTRYTICVAYMPLRLRIVTY